MKRELIEHCFAGRKADHRSSRTQCRSCIGIGVARPWLSALLCLILPQWDALADGRVIEEVIVTAQKSEQSLSQVPIAVSVISGDHMIESGAFDLDAIEVLLPSVKIEPEPSAPILTIRGFGTNGTAHFEPSVGLVQDEVALARPLFITDAVFDVERIEVLRGPQGTLFGKNSAAGAVNVTSKGPGESLQGSFAVNRGEFNSASYQAALGGPFSDRVGMRVALLRTTADGQIENIPTDTHQESIDRASGRLRLNWDISDALSLAVSASDSAIDIDNYWNWQLELMEPATEEYLRQFSATVEDDPRDLRTSLDQQGWQRLDTNIYSARLQWSLGEVWGLNALDAVFVAASARLYQSYFLDLDISPADLLRTDAETAYTQDTFELRFHGSRAGLFAFDEGFDFILGIYRYDATLKNTQNIDAGQDILSFLATEDAQELVSGENESTGNGGTDLLTAFGLDGIAAGQIGDDGVTVLLDQQTRTNSLFGQLTWRLSESISIIVGGRYDNEEKVADYASSSRGEFGITAALLEAEQFTTSAKRDEANFSPKVSVSYSLGDAGSIYASYSKGFKGGGFNGLAVKSNPELFEFEPEEATSYEIGIKTSLLDSTLRLTGAVYRTDFDNLQIQVLDASNIFVFNAATTTSQGVEAELQWLTPWEPLSINSAVGYTDIEYGPDVLGPQPIFQGSFGSLAGEPLLLAPEWTAMIRPELRFPVSILLQSLDFSIALELSRTARTSLDVDGDDNLFEKGHTMVGLSVALGSPDGGFTVSLTGKNITDERPINVGNDAPMFPGTYAVKSGNGSQLSLGLLLRI